MRRDDGVRVHDQQDQHAAVAWRPEVDAPPPDEHLERTEHRYSTPHATDADDAEEPSSDEARREVWAFHT
jgi:hypothetical protein